MEGVQPAAQPAGRGGVGIREQDLRTVPARQSMNVLYVCAYANAGRTDTINGCARGRAGRAASGTWRRRNPGTEPVEGPPSKRTPLPTSTSSCHVPCATYRHVPVPARTLRQLSSITALTPQTHTVRVLTESVPHATCEEVPNDTWRPHLQAAVFHYGGDAQRRTPIQTTAQHYPSQQVSAVTC